MGIKTLIEAIYYPALVIDKDDLSISHTNRAATDLLGTDVLDKKLSSIVSTNILSQILHMISVCSDYKNSCSEFIYVSKSDSKSLIPVEISVGSFKRDKEYLLVLLRTLQDYAERELKHSMDAYTVLRRINGLIISSQSPSEMLKASVEILHESGFFSFVSITAKYGNEIVAQKGEFNKNSITLCFPIRRDGSVEYILTVSKGEQFTLRELDLLNEVAYDLSFGLKRIGMDTEIKRRQFTDSFTGLPNRYYFLTYLKNAIEEAKVKRKRLTLALLDIDRFGEINQAFGYEAGDKLLSLISQQLRTSLKNSIFVSRVGADEFAIAFISDGEDEAYGDVLKTIVGTLSEPVMFEDYRVKVSFSVGVASYPQDASDFQELYSNAEVALQRAKSSGGGTILSYSKSFKTASKTDVEMRFDIKEALDREEFLLYLQPKIEISSGKIVGAEALARWKKGDKIIPPMKFIPLVESSELIHELGRFVLRKATQHLIEFEKEGVNIPIAINVSPKQLQKPELAEYFSHEFEKLKDPQLIEVEITESTIMEDTGKSTTFIDFLSSYGVKTYIDDFGTGYSSLAYLKRLPVYALKIDREFIKDLPQDKDSLELVKTMLSIAKTFGMKTVAEGVETEQQLNVLRELGCEYAQGYLFSPPVEVEKFKELYRKWT